VPQWRSATEGFTRRRRRGIRSAGARGGDNGCAGMVGTARARPLAADAGWSPSARSGRSMWSTVVAFRAQGRSTISKHCSDGASQRSSAVSADSRFCPLVAILSCPADGHLVTHRGDFSERARPGECHRPAHGWRGATGCPSRIGDGPQSSRSHRAERPRTALTPWSTSLFERLS
jgi:hypothetical protein